MARPWRHRIGTILVSVLAAAEAGCLAEPDVVLVPATDTSRTEAPGGAATGEETTPPASAPETTPTVDPPAPAPDKPGKPGKGGKGDDDDDD